MNDLTSTPTDERFGEEYIDRFYEYLNSKGECSRTVTNTTELEKYYEKDFYIHYRYKLAPTLFLVFNARGLVINNEYLSTEDPVENLERLLWLAPGGGVRQRLPSDSRSSVHVL